MTSILALDLGTTTGWALRPKDSEQIHHGFWSLKPGRFEGGGMRFLKFRNLLASVHGAHGPLGPVVFEEVRRHAGTDAAHIYGGLMATLTAFCEERQIPYLGVPVGTIKKFWTGHGGANKGAMIAEAVRRGFRVADDNEADAIALLHWQLEEGIYA
jgi:hypothetical protein